MVPSSRLSQITRYRIARYYRKKLQDVFGGNDLPTDVPYQALPDFGSPFHWPAAFAYADLVEPLDVDGTPLWESSRNTRPALGSPTSSNDQDIEVQNTANKALAKIPSLPANLFMHGLQKSRISTLPSPLARMGSQLKAPSPTPQDAPGGGAGPVLGSYSATGEPIAGMSTLRASQSQLQTESGGTSQNRASFGPKGLGLERGKLTPRKPHFTEMLSVAVPFSGEEATTPRVQTGARMQMPSPASGNRFAESPISPTTDHLAASVHGPNLFEPPRPGSPPKETSSLENIATSSISSVDEFETTPFQSPESKPLRAYPTTASQPIFITNPPPRPIEKALCMLPQYSRRPAYSNSPIPRNQMALRTCPHPYPPRAFLYETQRILCIIAAKHPDFTYCPMLTDIIFVFLTVMSPDETFACIETMVRMSLHNESRGVYFPTSAEACVTLIRGGGRILETKYPELTKHAKNLGVCLTSLLAAWISRCFVSYFSVASVMRIFDEYIREGVNLLVTLGIAFFVANEPILMRSTSPHQLLHNIQQLLALDDIEHLMGVRASLNITGKMLHDAANTVGKLSTYPMARVTRFVAPKVGPSEIMTYKDFLVVYSWLPQVQRIMQPKLLYSSSKHSYSLARLLTLVGEQPNILIVKHAEGVLGVYIPKWSRAGDYRLDGRTFIFQLRPQYKYYPFNRALGARRRSSRARVDESSDEDYAHEKPAAPANTAQKSKEDPDSEFDEDKDYGIDFSKQASGQPTAKTPQTRGMVSTQSRSRGREDSSDVSTDEECTEEGAASGEGSSHDDGWEHVGDSPERRRQRRKYPRVRFSSQHVGCESEDDEEEKRQASQLDSPPDTGIPSYFAPLPKACRPYEAPDWHALYPPEGVYKTVEIVAPGLVYHPPESKKQPEPTVASASEALLASHYELQKMREKNARDQPRRSSSFLTTHATPTVIESSFGTGKPERLLDVVMAASTGAESQSESKVGHADETTNNDSTARLSSFQQLQLKGNAEDYLRRIANRLSYTLVGTYFEIVQTTEEEPAVNEDGDKPTVITGQILATPTTLVFPDGAEDEGMSTDADGERVIETRELTDVYAEVYADVAPVRRVEATVKTQPRRRRSTATQDNSRPPLARRCLAICPTTFEDAVAGAVRVSPLFLSLADSFACQEWALLRDITPEHLLHFGVVPKPLFMTQTIGAWLAAFIQLPSAPPVRQLERTSSFTAAGRSTSYSASLSAASAAALAEELNLQRSFSDGTSSSPAQKQSQHGRTRLLSYANDVDAPNATPSGPGSPLGSPGVQATQQQVLKPTAFPPYYVPIVAQSRTGLGAVLSCADIINHVYASVLPQLLTMEEKARAKAAAPFIPKPIVPTDRTGRPPTIPEVGKDVKVEQGAVMGAATPRAKMSDFTPLQTYEVDPDDVKQLNVALQSTLSVPIESVALSVRKNYSTPLPDSCRGDHLLFWFGGREPYATVALGTSSATASKESPTTGIGKFFSSVFRGRKNETPQTPQVQQTAIFSELNLVMALAQVARDPRIASLLNQPFNKLLAVAYSDAVKDVQSSTMNKVRLDRDAPEGVEAKRANRGGFALPHCSVVFAPKSTWLYRAFYKAVHAGVPAVAVVEDDDYDFLKKAIPQYNPGASFYDDPLPQPQTPELDVVLAKHGLAPAPADPAAASSLAVGKRLRFWELRVTDFAHMFPDRGSSLAEPVYNYLLTLPAPPCHNRFQSSHHKPMRLPIDAPILAYINVLARLQPHIWAVDGRNVPCALVTPQLVLDIIRELLAPYLLAAVSDLVTQDSLLTRRASGGESGETTPVTQGPSQQDHEGKLRKPRAYGKSQGKVKEKRPRVEGLLVVTKNRIGVGDSTGMALQLDEQLTEGISEATLVFGNPSLANVPGLLPGRFAPQIVECWGFTRD